MDSKRTIADHLLRIGAVFLRPNEPFTWASGIKSPIYCDNRLTLSCPQARSAIAEEFAKLLSSDFPGCDILMGTATSGIPHAAIAAHIAGLPMGYVRSGAKGHGRGSRIEGKYSAGQKAVVVEDTISTAGSVLETVSALREEGIEVLGIISIFTYNMKNGLDRLAAANITNTSLTDFEILVEQAAKSSYITEADVLRLRAFRDNPSDESWINK